MTQALPEPDFYASDLTGDAIAAITQPLWLDHDPAEVRVLAPSLLGAIAVRLGPCGQSDGLTALARDLASGRPWTDSIAREVVASSQDPKVGDALVALAAAHKDGAARAYLLARLSASVQIDPAERDRLFLAWSVGAFRVLSPLARRGLKASWLSGTGRASARMGPDRSTLARRPDTLVVAPGLKPADSGESEPRRRRGILGMADDTPDPMLRRFAALASPLPVAGDLSPHPGGGFALTARLRTEFPWFGRVIDAIELALRLPFSRGRTGMTLAPMLLIGPPGCGKTRFAQRLAALADTGYGYLSAAGSTDVRMLLGTARGYSTAQPSWPAHVILEGGTANPVLLVDEIDKETDDRRNGRIADSLLAMIEPASAGNWTDECLMTGLDLTAVNWVLTANSTRGLNEALLSRLETHVVAQPGAAHFEALLAGILADIAERYGCRTDELPWIAPDRIAALKTAFSASPNARRLVAAVKAELAHALAPPTGLLQ